MNATNSSSVDPAMVQAAIDEFSGELRLRMANIYFEVAPLALLLYDIFLSLDDEIEYMWSRKFKAGTVFYLCARYPTLILLGIDLGGWIGWPSLMLFLAPVPSEHTSKVSVFCSLALGSTESPWVERMPSVEGTTMQAALFSVPRCTQNIDDVISASWIKLGTVVSVLSTVLHVFILGVTCYHTNELRKSLRRMVTKGAVSLTDLILHQGVLRFLIITVWDIEINLSSAYIKSLWGGIDSDVERAVVAILLCRYLITLKQYTSQTGATASHDISSIQFNELPQYVSESIIEEMGDGDRYSEVIDDSHSEV
ncbi:hypothetical protein M422DRAFT_46421 [Sphaerobolus stellatus SS14]|uniref:DUF6533 domain-containing protein n=1 Tax=Sphaerobolus stellatus (strain SS14) TaxID=990650 RepID=A0A0C9VTC3_SPHS4|nr:hypothetical protein M422DRAFT_46421 [Sphaerobolus stellatus SS14]